MLLSRNRLALKLTLAASVLGLFPLLASAEETAKPIELRCPTSDTAVSEEKVERISKTQTTLQPPKAVVLVMHGLNLKPSKMASIVQTLNESGYDVVRGSLSGHLGSEAEFKSVTRDLWLSDMHRSYCEARKIADAQKLPLHFVGFSLGALINLDLMNSRPDTKIHYDRMVLLAPAAAVNTKSYFVKAFRIFGRGFVVPSLANHDYRANEGGTPVAAYNALFESIAQIESNGIKQNEIPTLIMIDPDDELVSKDGLESLIETNQLSNWSLMKVSNFDSRMTDGKYHHLIIDELSLGPSEWNFLKTAMLTHLDGKSIDPATFQIEECGKTGAWKTPKSDHCEKDADSGCNRYRNVCVPL